VSGRCDVLGLGAHPDDLEVATGGAAAKLAAQGLPVPIVDLGGGEPAPHAARGERADEARRAASIEATVPRRPCPRVPWTPTSR
jgi:LmbE family N-acetylglucosaminyl deacetylase